jgi:hypothetical protein
MATTELSELSSFHTNTDGTFGGAEAPFTPTVMASMPTDVRRGITPLVIPGTSLWLMLIVLFFPNRAS